MEDQKRRQVEYHEREHYREASPRMVDNSHPYVDWLNNYRLRKAAEMMNAPLHGKTVLSVCGGDGQEADFFHEMGAKVTLADLSLLAVKSAQVRNPNLCSVCTDAESLTFANASFDWVVVRDGLHHLARPLKGFYEIERVAREGFVILEGQDSLAVRCLSRFGIAENWDPAGGYVYRFSRRELRKVFSSMQTVSEWKIHTAWLPFGSDVLAHVPAFKRLVYPAINQPIIAKLLMSKFVKSAARNTFEAITATAGYWGNSLIVVARKLREDPKIFPDDRSRAGLS